MSIRFATWLHLFNTEAPFNAISFLFRYRSNERRHPSIWNERNEAEVCRRKYILICLIKSMNKSVGEYSLNNRQKFSSVLWRARGYNLFNALWSSYLHIVLSLIYCVLFCHIFSVFFGAFHFLQCFLWDWTKLTMSYKEPVRFLDKYLHHYRQCVSPSVSQFIHAFFLKLFRLRFKKEPASECRRKNLNTFLGE